MCRWAGQVRDYIMHVTAATEYGSRIRWQQLHVHACTPPLSLLLPTLPPCKSRLGEEADPTSQITYGGNVSCAGEDWRERLRPPSPPQMLPPCTCLRHDVPIGIRIGLHATLHVLVGRPGG